eukprot:3078110-Prymnesium_polylepis.1
MANPSPRSSPPLCQRIRPVHDRPATPRPSLALPLQHNGAEHPTVTQVARAPFGGRQQQRLQMRE